MTLKMLHMSTTLIGKVQQYLPRPVDYGAKAKLP